MENLQAKESMAIKNIVKGVVIALLTTFILLIIFSIILTYTNTEEKVINPVIMLITAISILIGSSLANIKIKKNGLLNGGIVGVTANIMDRVKALVDAQVDVIVIDTAHGHSANVLKVVKMVRDAYPDLGIIAGNVATGEATRALIEAGVDAVKVGIGPGSICTTRVVAGIGVPQITAIMDSYNVAKEYGIPVIANGGIKYSGDMTKAIAAGANVCMMGSIFAGCD